MIAAAKDPTPYLWWLASRASGIVALALVTVAVILGLTMSSRLLRRPGIGRTLLSLHEHVALVGLGAIAVHGLTLLGDPWLRPGLRGLTVPFAMSYRPLYTGLGILSGYLAALLGLSFYARRRIGARLWRKAHRATVLVYLLGLVHAIGSGTDASAVWFRWWALATTPVIAGLFLYRAFGPRLRGARLPAPRSRPAPISQTPVPEEA
jgi:sulfoxide reductase heme-binding subunit YedZ